MGRRSNPKPLSFLKKFLTIIQLLGKISKQLDGYQEEVITSLIRAELGRRSGGMRNMMSDQSPFFEALVEGADPADLVQGDGIWRSNPDADRAADPWFFENLQQRTLPTGGQLEDPARDLY